MRSSMPTTRAGASVDEREALATRSNSGRQQWKGEPATPSPSRHPRCFLRLANSLSALYPRTSDEKRLLDAMLLAAR